MSRSLPLYTIVFISGGSVLAIEILGTRILGPFYGVSLFLWSALITVTLAALSIGYAIGGRWADRSPTYFKLGCILFASGILIMGIPWLKYPVLKLAEPLGLRPAVLVAATALFALPLTLMGMVSPLAIRLQASRLENVGKTAGNIYAISTVASVVAALATGFVLVPSVGVNRLVLGIGLAMLLAGLIALIVHRSTPKNIVAAVLTVGVLGSLGTLLMPQVALTSSGNGVIAHRESAYADLRVVDWNEFRFLLIDGGGHTVTELASSRTVYPYAVVMDLCKFYYQKPGKMLLMGLGGGSVAKSYAQSGWDVTTVEIDPAITDMAKGYFGLSDQDTKVYHEDARGFVMRDTETYDLILIDAFGSAAIPFHLVTQEAFGAIKNRLAPGGVIAMNVESIGWNTMLIRSLGATLETKFDHVAALPLVEPPNKLGNLVILATDRDIETFPEDKLERPYDVLSDPYEHWRVVAQNHAWDNRFRPEAEQGQVLTDDHNPVDLWSEEVNLAARRSLHNDYEWRSIAW